MITAGPLLAVEALEVRYGDSLAIGDVSVELDEGQVLAVLGANGAGKSSFARAVTGLVPPSNGRVLLAGRDVTGMPANKLRPLGIAYLPETRGIFPTLTAEDNLRMAAGWLKGRGTRAQSLQRAYDLFPFLAGRRSQVAGTLSGGEQQMLALACQIAVGAKVLVADELSLGLAPKIVDDVFDQLDRARQEGVSIILIEQFVDRALLFAEKVLVLRQGGVAWNGAAKDITVGDLRSEYIV